MNNVGSRAERGCGAGPEADAERAFDGVVAAERPRDELADAVARANVEANEARVALSRGRPALRPPPRFVKTPREPRFDAPDDGGSLQAARLAARASIVAAPRRG